MNKKCPKCGYERKPTDLISENECPKCGVIYEKFDKGLHSSTTREEDKKRCPYCGEQILSVAIKCKHCGEYLTNESDITNKIGHKHQIWNIPHRNLIIASFLFFVLLGAIFLYFTPHLAVHSMKNAAENNDAEKLSDYVDYPSLRESLKASFSAALADKVATSPRSGFGEAIGASLAVALINPIINSLVTPESLATLMKSHVNKDIHSDPLPETSSKNPPPKSQADDDISMGYRGLNEFVVKFKRKNISEERAQFIFKRKGIFSWKLSALRLPQNLFSDFPGYQNNDVGNTVGRVGRARQRAARSTISLFETALDTYRLDIGKYPTTAQGLKALRERPNDVHGWDGPYLPKDIPMDPWGNPYQYLGDHNSFSLISYGADGKLGGKAEDTDLTGS